MRKIPHITERNVLGGIGMYFGDGSDGDLTVSGTVALASGSNGEAIVKNYQNLTINSGGVLTVTNKCKGLIIKVRGTLTLNGTISMNAKCPYCATLPSALTYHPLTTYLEKCIRSIRDNDLISAINAAIVTIPALGGAGGTPGGSGGSSSTDDGSPDTSTPNSPAPAATNGSGAGGGGGGQGGDTGSGGAGYCYGGGSGGGGSNGYITGGRSSGQDYGGAGGSPAAMSGYPVGGGGGAPGGGLLVVMAKSIIGNGTLSANGSVGGASTTNDNSYADYRGGGGGAGGGLVYLFYASKDGTPTLLATGGAGGEGGCCFQVIDDENPGRRNLYFGPDGGAGGTGSVRQIAVASDLTSGAL